jgi:hypothetical protein
MRKEKEALLSLHPSPLPLPPPPPRNLTCEAFPGVVLPPFLNTVGSLAMSSRVAPALMPSSWEMVTLVSAPVLGSLICRREEERECVRERA